MTGILVDCTFARWQPGLGDAHLMGFVITAAYSVAAGMSFLMCRKPGIGAERIFWISVTAVMSFLAINKQLDLQTGITALGRCISRAQDWYESRRPFQIVVTLFFCLAVVSMYLALIRSLKFSAERSKLAIAGLCLLVAFVLIRTVGLHHADTFFEMGFAGVRMIEMLELSGIILIALNATTQSHIRTPRITSPHAHLSGVP